ncbi:MAG: 50S ribosomal protein L11 methyltransferase [Desulfobacterales bacterium]|nr:MAG: 50S ribosomal protein L11 methyltransferase [Desulfobacterales bacterium]
MNKSDALPYENLYIYYLAGRLQTEKQIASQSFIGNWEEDDFTFLFFSAPAEEEVTKLLRREPQLSYIDHYHMAYDQWQGGKVTAFRHGGFCITPPWEWNGKCPAAVDKELNILLDPGVVFGTGRHTTTRDCLEALELITTQQIPSIVLDLGTGTGLLALAAARLGCRKVLAVDLNSLAAKTAAKNVRLNRMEEQVLVVQGRAEDFIGCPADLIIANIHYEVMQRLINFGGLRGGKNFILSGLMRSQAKDVLARLAQYPVKILKTWTCDGIWYTFCGKMI